MSFKGTTPAVTGSPWSSNPPTQPGTYWFRREPSSREILVQVSVKDGVLTVWWPNIDQPVEKFKEASWRGPIPPSTSPGSR